eukprot:UN08407
MIEKNNKKLIKSIDTRLKMHIFNHEIVFFEFIDLMFRVILCKKYAPAQ